MHNRMSTIYSSHQPARIPAPPSVGGRLPHAAAMACATAGIVYVLGAAAVSRLGLGPLSHHMATHILVMDAVALAFAATLMAAKGPGGVWPRPLASLVWATTVQLIVLWAWHAPPALDAAMTSPPAAVAMKASLFAVAVWFWGAVLAHRGAGRWRSIFALLVTAKLFCLLGVVLVFAPRPLYGGELADQQIAGLIMLGACPLTYVLAGIVIAARWLLELEVGASGPVRARDRA
jgi:putative membrane protein